MVINLGGLQSYPSCEDTASGTKGITQSRCKYLHCLMTASWFVKKSRRKNNYLHYILHT